MDHASRENIFDELNNFEKRKPTEIPPILEDYLILIGKSGDIIFSWAKLKPLFKYKLDRVIKQFNEDYPAKDLAYSPNVDKFNYDDMRAKLLNAVEEFSGAPFTIQRLCELVMCPDKHYKRVDKFMRALEKDLLVVSTIEPLCKRQKTDSETSSLVNGVTETTGSLNGNVQSPQSTVDPNEEANVESTDEQGNQVPTEQDVVVAGEAENVDLESEAEANENEPLKGENGPTTLTEDMETTVSSSSTPELNKSQMQEVEGQNALTADEDAGNSILDNIPALLPNEKQIEEAEAECNSVECNSVVEGHTPSEVQPSSDLNDNDIVSDSSEIQQVSTCSEDQLQEKEAEVKSDEASSNDSEAFKGIASPESSDRPIPDSVSQSDAPTTEFVAASPPGSVEDSTVETTSSLPESSVQPEEPCTPESTTNVVVATDPDPGDSLLPDPEPMEED